MLKAKVKRMRFVIKDRRWLSRDRKMVQVYRGFCSTPIILPAVLTTRASRALFLADRFPYQVTMLKERTLSTRQRYSRTCLPTPKLRSFLNKYKRYTDWRTCLPTPKLRSFLNKYKRYTDWRTCLPTPKLRSFLNKYKRYTDWRTCLPTPKLRSFLNKYKRCSAFLYTETTLSLKRSFESTTVPRYLILDTTSTDCWSVVTGINESFSFLLSNTSSFVFWNIWTPKAFLEPGT